MNETIKVTSTARKISRSWLWQLFWIFFWLNLALIAASLFFYCYANESAVLGSAWSLRLQRELQPPIFAWDSSFFSNLKKLPDILSETQYSFMSPSGSRHIVSFAAYMKLFLPTTLYLLIFEAILFLGQVFSGRKTARRLLRPLDKMAMAARKLSHYAQTPQPDKDDQKLHNLEDAIGRISPDHPEQKLDMGDQDLAGLQDAINALLQRMHESYRQQAQFVSDASHELRTPIAVIQGYANMLDRWGKQDEKVLDESIAAIKSETAYMNHLIEQLLFLARGDTGRNRLEIVPLQLDEIAKEVYEDCLLIDRKHDWRINVQPGAECAGDHDLIKQCARILVENAMKYTPENGVISLRAFRSADGMACLQVQDSGIGISGEDASRGFDRFYRSDPARTRESGGTGLGLSIAQWIAQRHGGHIDLLSREGIGTRMTLYLPSKQAE